MSVEETLALYKKALEQVPHIPLKGKNNSYTSHNGYMFSFVNKDGELGIRLSKDDYKAFYEAYNSKPFISYGATMREYVTIPENMVEDTNKIAELLEKSFDYIDSLPPKPTTKKK